MLELSEGFRRRQSCQFGSGILDQLQAEGHRETLRFCTGGSSRRAFGARLRTGVEGEWMLITSPGLQWRDPAHDRQQVDEWEPYRGTPR